MHRNPTVKQMWNRALVLALGGALAGCAGTRPVAELARADQAIRHAQSTSDAVTTAPAELARAQAKLASARQAMADGDYADARDLADQARAYAELAEEKAESQRAVGAARQTLTEVEVLRTETASAPEPVVVERRSVTQSALPSVVVERPAPGNVAVEHGPPAAPVSVVVERPQPPSGVVVSHDPAVIVLPE